MKDWRGLSFLLFLGCALVCLTVASVPLEAQGTGTSSLKGTVSDPTGAVIAGAEVTLTNEATGSSRTATTGPDGGYMFPQVSPGTYMLRVAMQGFRTSVNRDLSILVATPATFNVELEVGAIAETVEVEATVAGINTEDATMGDTFTELQVKQLPFQARNAVAMLTLQPGVVFTGESDMDLLAMGSTADFEPTREGVVNGVRNNQSNVTLDGVDFNDPQQQAAFSSAVPLSLDSLQEFRVVTTNANVTEGVAAGAQVQLVTKGGSNDIHGNIRWFHRNDATAANLFFNKAVVGDEVPTPKQIRNQFGFSVGGPFVKDRAFFFADYEQRRDNDETSRLVTVPTDTLKSGIFRYETTVGTVATLDAAAIAALDANIGTNPALTGAPLGINPAMQAFMALFPSGNSPLESRDDGLNFNVLRFNAPIGFRNNLYALRFDFNLDREGKHKVFWRGNLGDVKTDFFGPPQLPGQPPSVLFLNNGKGMGVSYTAQLRPTLINTFTWGFTRAGVERTGRDGDIFSVRSFSTNTSFARASGRKIPNHNIRDDITWVRGRHTVQGGLNILTPRNERFTKAISFGGWFVNNGFCGNLCRDPVDFLAADADPNNDPADVTTFVRAFMMLTGSITQVNATFFVDPAGGGFLPIGTPQARDFAENDFEFYIQDSWRIRPDLTLTGGLRYSYFGPVWEQNGFQVRPTVDVRDWWSQRVNTAEAGLPTDVVAPLQFNLAGKANNAPAWYDPDKNNFAPRVALAWSPGFDSGVGKAIFGSGGESVLRIGGGVFFHRIGGALAASNDVNGSPGLSNGLLSPVAQFDITDAPRFGGSCDFSGCGGFPALSTFITTPTATFPATPGLFTDNVSFMLDNNITAPYSYNLNLSFQREIKGVTFESAYVGTFGRQLLTKTDFSQLMWNFTDPASGGTLEQAFNQVVGLLRTGFDPFATAPTPIPFIENVFSNMCVEYGFLLPGACANNTQAFTALAFFFDPTWSDMIFLLDVSDPIDGFCPIDISLDPECFGAGPGVPGRVFFQQQFNTLRGWVNWGSSNYHSWQLSARKTGADYTFNANYVLSKSIDNGSAPENADIAGGSEFTGSIPNPLRPKAHRAVSDFDLRHNFNANWVVQLPIGRGRALGTDAGGVVDQIIGGWQVSGAWRWRSGFPLSPANGFNFPTNFFLTGPGTATGPVNTNVTGNAQGDRGPNLFRDPDAAFNLINFTNPAGIGSRNIIRSDGFFSVDFGLGKTVRLGERARLQFRWEVFNLFNNVNFDSDDVDLDPESPGTFGQFFSTAGGFPQQGARDMQFVVRIDF